MTKIGSVGVVRTRKTKILGAKLGNFRVTTNKTNCHLYLRALSGSVGGATGGHCTVASISTLDTSKRTGIKMKRSKLNALLTGRTLALRLTTTGIRKVSFSRLNHKYHGLIRMVAESARNYGLCF